MTTAGGTGSARDRKACEMFCVQARGVEQAWGFWESLTAYESLKPPPARELHQSLPLFVVAVQHALLVEVVMGLARLTDRNKSKSQRNLVASDVYELATGLADAHGKHALYAAYVTLRGAVTRANVKGVRDKLFAHLDRSIATGELPLPKHDLHQVGVAVRALGSLQHRIERILRGAEVNLADPTSAYARTEEQSRRDAELTKLLTAMRARKRTRRRRPRSPSSV